MKQISILGCGWLGFPLAKELINKGFSINGSTTSFEKLEILEAEKNQSFLISLTEEGVIGDVSNFLNNSEILIIDIPPKLRGLNSENFVEKIQNIIPFIIEAKIEKVLFVSSTSVYSDDNELVTEVTIPNPDTESGKQLLETEQLLQNNPNFKTTILRFGGLIGNDRHPVKHLAGKQNLENPQAPVNLIHQEDCIGIIQSIIVKETFGEIFNAVAPFHPSRKEYYSKKALQLGLPAPHFNDDEKTNGKIIDSQKISTLLHYTFKSHLYS